MAYTQQDVTMKSLFSMLTYFSFFLEENEAAATVAVFSGFPAYRIASQRHPCALSSLRCRVVGTEDGLKNGSACLYKA